jgi:hypothetical protein
MKNQYFGDNKDLFTYDLIYQIMQAGLVNHFTFIPMLTSNDDTENGGKYNRDKAKVGTKNKELMSFLDGCIREGRRNIKELEGFFTKQGIEMTIYEKPFSHQNRQEYFAQIGDELLTKSLILVDPDIGLEVARSGEKHLRLDEVQNLYQRMGEHSILMLFQNITGDSPICIDDDEIIFFFLTRNDSLEHSLTHLIEEYAESYSQ